jgi:hypothetical protein
MKRTDFWGPLFAVWRGRWGRTFLIAWFAVLCFLVLRFATGCCDVPAADPCKAVCEDPAYPVPCLVERPEGDTWTCAVDVATCESVPGLPACEPPPAS